MTDELEKRLREALRPLDPPAGFADRVLARLDEEPVATRALPTPSGKRVLQRYWYSGAALAASIVFAVIAIDRLEGERREREGLEARRQLIEALRMTSETLDLAYQAVNPPPPPDDTAGLMSPCTTSYPDLPCATGV